MSTGHGIVAAGVILIITHYSIVKVPEGHVAVYFRGGALLSHVDDSGYHVKLPGITHAEFVQTSVQTDKVLKIPCGTSGGTMLEFERIEVVNRLVRDMVHQTVKNYTVNYDKTWIYDKIHHEINQICSRSTLEEMYISKFETLDESLRDALQMDIEKYAPGIQIIAIRVTKPSIPSAIRINYEAIEGERTKLMVAKETRRVVEEQALTEKQKAIIEAEKIAAVDAVQCERRLRQQENERNIEKIKNEMHLSQMKANADANYYTVMKEAESNKMLHTPEMIQIESMRAISNNTKFYFGDSLPNVVSILPQFPVN